MLMIASALGLSLLLLGFLLSHSNSLPRENSTPFECGFDPFNNARVPFSLRYFLLALIFVIFDIEIVLLLPLPLISFTTSPLLTTLYPLGFIAILLIGTIHEWNEGSLHWSN